MNSTPNSDAALQTQCPAGRFNPTFCGKVARIAAAVYCRILGDYRSVDDVGAAQFGVQSLARPEGSD